MSECPTGALLLSGVKAHYLKKPLLYAGHQKGKESSFEPNQPILYAYNFQKYITTVIFKYIYAKQIYSEWDCFEHVLHVAFGTEASTMQHSESTSHSLKRKAFIRSTSHKL